MTMNDHEGKGSPNDHVVTWTEMYFASAVRLGKDCMNSQFEQLNDKFLVMNLIVPTCYKKLYKYL